MGAASPGRRQNGTFAAGCSGNAGGRPKLAESVRDLARRHTETAISTLVTIAEQGEHEAARVSAATALLDRGWGRPTQPLSGDDDMPPIGLTVEDKAEELARRQAATQAILDAAFGKEGAEE
jgi:hypothetical protein